MVRRRRSRAGGFTLIELMIVVVIVAALASIALFRMYSARDRAYVATVRQDLKNLVTAQEAYHDNNQTYAGDLGDLSGLFSLSQNVSVEVDSASDTGWGAHGTHPGAEKVCRVSVSQGATGIVSCEDGSG